MSTTKIINVKEIDVISGYGMNHIHYRGAGIVLRDFAIVYWHNYPTTRGDIIYLDNNKYMVWRLTKMGYFSFIRITPSK